jgi:hypothetical protein
MNTSMGVSRALDLSNNSDQVSARCLTVTGLLLPKRLDA